MLYRNTKGWASRWLVGAVFAVILLGAIATSADTPAGDAANIALTATSAPVSITPGPPSRTPTYFASRTITPTHEITPFAAYNIDLDDYEIWYLADEDVLKGVSLISADSLFDDVMVNQISAAQDLDTEHYPDVLIVHHSVAEWLDQAYVAAAVRRGVILATIDVPLEERADWMDSECMRRTVNYGALVGQYEYTVFWTWTQVMTEKSADALAMADLGLNYDCSVAAPEERTPIPPELLPDIDGPLFAHGSSSILGIESAEDTYLFREALKIKLHNRNNAQQTFQERFTTPVATPKE